MTDVRLHLQPGRSREAWGPLASIECADGTTISVQASRYHYCEPRNETGPWSLAEVGGMPSAEPALMRWAEDHDADPSDTVYAWVPVAVIQAVVDAHEACGRLANNDEDALVMADALREVGRLRSPGGPETWTASERYRFGRCYALLHGLAAPRQPRAQASRQVLSLGGPGQP